MQMIHFIDSVIQSKQSYKLKSMIKTINIEEKGKVCDRKQ